MKPRGRLLAYIFQIAAILASNGLNVFYARAAPPSELRVCTQNLHRFGESRSNPPLRNGLTQQDLLVRRFIDAKCDIIAVQEIFGGDTYEATQNLNRLSQALARETRRPFAAYTGENEHDLIRNGFLVATDIAAVEKTESMDRARVSGLTPLGPSHRPTRPPYGLLVTIRPKSGAPQRKLFLGNIHLKSKLGGWKDPTSTQYETLRMEVADAVRDWVRSESTKSGPNTIGMILGDRNSNDGSASAEILRGARTLADFREHCQVDHALLPVCDKTPVRAPAFVPLLAQTKEKSYRYHSQEEVIDEILIEAEDYPLAQTSSDQTHAGVVGRYNAGSDHKLVWTELDW